MSDSSRHRWPQFSLRTALLLIVVAAVAASLWVSTRQFRENERLRQDLTKLRNETGLLTIEPGQEHKVHAIAVPVALDARTWRWRIYVPAGRRFGLQVNTQSSNSSGSSSSSLTPGESVIEVGLRRDLKGHWDWVVRELNDRSSGETRVTASGNVEQLINNYSAQSNGVGQATQSVEPGADLELLKFEMTGSAPSGGPTNRTATEAITVRIHEGSSK